MNTLVKPNACDYASWIIAALGFVLVLEFHLLQALIAGLLVCELVHALYPLFSGRLSTNRAKGLAVIFVALLVVGMVSAAIFGLVGFMRSEGGSFPTLLAKMAEILEHSREQLPKWLANLLPHSTQIISDNISVWLRSNASELQRIGKETGHMVARMLIGMIIGALVAMRELRNDDQRGPFAKALTQRMVYLGEAFRRIVFAQVRISALNTVFTTLYLIVALPLFGISLPLTKTMIIVTFIAGMLPVVGNLISNSVIFVVSLAHSPTVAAASLTYLIAIHKLEYFLNARIVGHQINARAWELLAAMLIMESIFGVPGLVAAPFGYAWLKDELTQRGLI